MLLDQRVGQFDDEIGVVDDDQDADVFILQCSGESAKNCSTYPTEESCGLTNTCTWTTTTTAPGPITNANPMATTNANPTTTTTTTTRNTTSSCQPGEQV